MFGSDGMEASLFDREDMWALWGGWVMRDTSL